MQVPQTKPRSRAQISAATLAERLAEADAGSFITAESIEEWVASWFAPDELPPPEADMQLGRRL